MKHISHKEIVKSYLDKRGKKKRVMVAHEKPNDSNYDKAESNGFDKPSTVGFL